MDVKVLQNPHLCIIRENAVWSFLNDKLCYLRVERLESSLRHVDFTYNVFYFVNPRVYFPANPHILL